MLSRAEIPNRRIKEEKNMAEMTEEKWTTTKTLIEGWFSSHPDWEQHVELIAVPQLMAATDAKPEQREALYGAIRTCFADIQDKPFRSGRGSTMPDAVLIARDAILAEYYNAQVDLFNSNVSIQTLEMRHGKSGGGNYTNATEYADDKVASRRQMLNKAYSDFTKNNTNAQYLWNGENPVVLVNTSSEEDE